LEALGLAADTAREELNNFVQENLGFDPGAPRETQMNGCGQSDHVFCDGFGMDLSELQLTAHPDGVIVPIRVVPRARRAAIVEVHGGALKVSLTDPPVDGAANAGLIKLLAKTLRIPKGDCRIIRGARSRDKAVLVCLDEETLRARLLAARS
jgi:uncharacterized protein (TIGR00251 family)